MKTPEEIKKALACPVREQDYLLGCSCCSYHGRGKPPCLPEMHEDALAYIQQLEAERDALSADLEEYVKRVIGRTGGIYACTLCKHWRSPYDPNYFKTRCPSGCGGFRNWEWRGVSEPPKEDNHGNA